MGLFIKNPEVERMARELAALKGTSMTAALAAVLEAELRLEKARAGQAPRRRRNLEEMRAATARFRRQAGLEGKRFEPVSKGEWDALWPTGIPEIDEA